MERISQIVLIVVGVLVLVVLTVGLAVACRQQPPDASATLPPGATPASTIAATWTPLSGADLTGTVTAAAPIPAGQTPTPTPTPFGATPDTNPTPGSATPGGIVTPGGSATPTPGVGTPGGPTATPVTDATPPGGPTPGVATPAPIASPPPDATAAPPAATATPITYVPGATVRHTVNRGEWLLQIARCYGAPYAGVHAANALPDPDFILPGQVIIVPNVGTIGRVIGPPCVQAYFVQAGDTWESLATRFGTTTAILQRANPGALALGRAIWAPRN